MLDTFSERPFSRWSGCCPARLGDDLGGDGGRQCRVDVGGQIGERKVVKRALTAVTVMRVEVTPSMVRLNFASAFSLPCDVFPTFWWVLPTMSRSTNWL